MNQEIREKHSIALKPEKQHSLKVKVKLMNPLARVPEYKTKGAACFDLYSTEEVIVYPGEKGSVGLGVAFEIPEGWELELRPRSGMSFKTDMLFKNTPATIDSDYRGEIRALFYNQGKTNYRIRVGDRVCQGKFNKVNQVFFMVVDGLSETERGEGGFGSTGVNDEDKPLQYNNIEDATNKATRFENNA